MLDKVYVGFYKPLCYNLLKTFAIVSMTAVAMDTRPLELKNSPMFLKFGEMIGLFEVFHWNVGFDL